MSVRMLLAALLGLIVSVQSQTGDKSCHVHSITVLIYESKPSGGFVNQCYSRGNHLRTLNGIQRVENMDQGMCDVTVMCKNHAPHFKRAGSNSKNVKNECNRALVLVVDDFLTAICIDESDVKHDHQHDDKDDHGDDHADDHGDDH